MNTRIVFQKKMGKTSALQYMVLAIGIFFMNNMILNLYAEVFGLPVMEAKLLTCLLYTSRKNRADILKKLQEEVLPKLVSLDRCV